MWVPRSLNKSPEHQEQSRDSRDERGVRGTQETQQSHSQSSQQQQTQHPAERSRERTLPTGTHKLTGGQMAVFRSKREWGVEDHHNFKSRQAKIHAAHGAQAASEDHLRRWEAAKAYWDLTDIKWNVSQSQLWYLFEEMEKEIAAVNRHHQRQQSTQRASVATSQQQAQTPAPRPTPQIASVTQSSGASSAPANVQPGSFQDQQARAYEERKPEGSSNHTAERRASEDGSVFSSSQQLQPTFSLSIVRTPQHYSSASAAAAAHSASAQPSTPTPVRTSQERPPQPSPRTHGPIYGPPARTPSRTSSDPTLQTTPSRSTPSSLSRGTGPSPLSYLPTFSEEPADELLSPLVGVSQPPLERPSRERSGSEARPGRELSRAQTVPSFSSSSSFPEDRSPRSPPPTSSTRTPRPSPHAPPSAYPAAYREDAATPTPTPPSRRSPGDSRTLGRAQTMPNIDPNSPAQPLSHSRSTSSSRMTSPSASPSSYSRPHSPPGHSPSRSRKPSRSPLRNPLPSPPVPSVYASSSWQTPEKAMASMNINGASRAYSHPVPETHPSRERDRDRDREREQPRSQSYPQPSHAPRPSPSNGYPSSSSYVSPRSTAVSSASSSASSAARALVMSRQESSDRERDAARSYERGREPERIRRGFWNRRGDYLHVEGHGQNEMRYIVYAPRKHANPDELHEYPLPTQGFMDHHRDFIKYDPNTPEYPDSLPKHGEPPVMPYETVSSSLLFCVLVTYFACVFASL